MSSESWKVLRKDAGRHVPDFSRHFALITSQYSLFTFRNSWTYSRDSIVTPITTGAQVSGPFTSSIVAIFSARSGVTAK